MAVESTRTDLWGSRQSGDFSRLPLSPIYIYLVGGFFEPTPIEKDATVKLGESSFPK